MRIRKSQLLSSFSPVPLSDLHHPSPVVQLPPPSDQPLLSDYSSAADTGAAWQPLKQFGSEEHGRAPRVEAQDQTRKGSISGSQTVADHVLSPSTPSDDQDGRWCEGEKAIPFKKRRGSFKRIIKVEEEEEVTQNDDKKKKRDRSKMKTKMNKKCSREEQDEEEEEKVEEGGEKKGKRGRGSAVMEGSRCSRVNGRGWRCCQQTLVGYSLCEHHLGKGRLRSISSVKPRSLPGPKPEHHHLLSHELSTNSSSSDDVHVVKQTQDHQQEEKKNNKKPEMTMGKKRMKLGVVKARSISSLLGLPLLDNTKS